MIGTNLTGNFGDHFVRYALARTVAEKNGYEWAINKTPSHDYYGGREQLDFFDLDYGLPNDTPYGQTPSWANNTWIEKSATEGKGYNFYPYQPDVFNVPDNTNLVIYCGQDARYYDKNKLKKWFTIKENIADACAKTLKENLIVLDENLTVINCRGGEYRGVKSLFIEQTYYQRACNKMLSINPDMRFIVVTDDVSYYQNVFNYPVYHFSIAYDYYIINHAKNLILSNSGFAIFPTWLNNNIQNIIAPKYWARYNEGQWANSDMRTFSKDDNWLWLDRNGDFFTYEEVINERL